MYGLVMDWDKFPAEERLTLWLIPRPRKGRPAFSLAVHGDFYQFGFYQLYSDCVTALSFGYSKK
jgi:hypothetical protein